MPEVKFSKSVYKYIIIPIQYLISLDDCFSIRNSSCRFAVVGVTNTEAEGTLGSRQPNRTDSFYSGDKSIVRFLGHREYNRRRRAKTHVSTCSGIPLELRHPHTDLPTPEHSISISSPSSSGILIKLLSTLKIY